MTRRIPERFARWAGVVTLALASLLAPLVVSVAAPGVAGAATLSSDINGRWTDMGSAKPRITVSENGSVTIDLSYANFRPIAAGTVTSATSFTVTFPDAGTFSAQLLSPTFIQWSNGSTWQKVYEGPTAVNLYQDWNEGATSYNPMFPGPRSTGYIGVSMGSRPDAVGFALDASTIQVTFPDDATYQGWLSPWGYIYWSNGSVWTPHVVF